MQPLAERSPDDADLQDQWMRTLMAKAETLQSLQRRRAALDYLRRARAIADRLTALDLWDDSGPASDAAAVVSALGRAADPDLALATLTRLADQDDLMAALRSDAELRRRFTALVGASTALGDHLVRHPEQWRELTDPTLGSTRPAAYAVRADLLRAVAEKPDGEAVDALRVEYRRLLLRLAARDLTHHLGVDDVRG